MRGGSGYADRRAEVSRPIGLDTLQGEVARGISNAFSERSRTESEKHTARR